MSRMNQRAIEAMKTASAASQDAHRWHQGSGTHTDALIGWMETVLEAEDPSHPITILVLELLADAVVAEAELLHQTGGEWLTEGDAPIAWEHSNSGAATDLVKRAMQVLLPHLDVHAFFPYE